MTGPIALPGDDFLEPKRIIGNTSTISFMLQSFRGLVGLWVSRVKKFHNVEAALIHIEMNVSFFKIGGVGFPNPHGGIPPLYGLPRSKSHTATLANPVEEKELQIAMAAIMIGGHHRPTHGFPFVDNV